MSLVCHRIVSTYTPESRDTVVDEVEQDAVWEKERAFGNATRLHSKPTPTFIPAILKYDEFGMPKKEEELEAAQDFQTKEVVDVASWYRSMTTKRDLQTELRTPKPNGPTTTSATISTHDNTSQTALSQHHTSPKLDWFSSQSSNRIIVNSTPSTLADLLSRNPPPLPREPAFTPPVFLALGPANKGFTMLQKKGWREGEGLGKLPRAGLAMKQNVKTEVVDLTQSDDEEQEGIIDLTGLASDVEDEEELGGREEEEEDVSAEDKYEFPSHGGTALITPLGTVLKADRLGIGLKARRTKRKAVTHSPAEIAAFIRSRKQAERQKWGRGSKGFARKSREEERRRVQVLKYLNE